MAGLGTRLVETVVDEEAPEAVRIEAAGRLAQLARDADTLAPILESINAKATPSLAAGLLESLGRSESDAVGTLLVEAWGRLTPALRKAAADVMLRRPSWTAALLDGMNSDEVRISDLGIDQTRRLAEHPDKTIAERASGLLARDGSMPSPDRARVLAELLPLTERTGSVSAGKLVFEKNCAKCHKHGDLGETIGPDLSGFNVHPKDEILTQIIDPNRSVEGNYRQYTVATSEGQIFSGLLASETRTAVELVDSEAKRHVILRDDIDEMIASDKSLMPEGFETQVPPDELVDLLEFLAAKGKYVPLPMEKAATIVSTRGMFFNPESEAETLVFPDWSPKIVEGVPVPAHRPPGLEGPEPHPLEWTQRHDRADDAEVGRTPRAFPRQGDPRFGGRGRLGLSLRPRRGDFGDHPPPLRRRPDRGHPLAQRRPDRRLHPPGRRPRVELRLRPQGEADPLLRRHSRAPGADRTHRARQGRGRFRADLLRDYGGDTLIAPDFACGESAS